MADIELVIKIPEEDYEIMKHNIAVDNPLCPLSEKEMVAIIANGIPLPKGHGRLIDANGLENLRFSERSNVWLMDKILKSDTIVKADQESDINEDGN